MAAAACCWPSSLRLSRRLHAHSLLSCVVCIAVCAPSHAARRASTAAATACVRERVVAGGGGHEHRARRHVTATHWCGCCCCYTLSRRVLHRCRCRCCAPRVACASVRVVCVTVVRHCPTCIVPSRHRGCVGVCAGACVCVCRRPFSRGYWRVFLNLLLFMKYIPRKRMHIEEDTR